MNRLFRIALKTLAGFDWLLVLIVLLLTVFGLSTIYSVDLSRGDELIYFPTQIRSIIIGFGLLFGAGMFHYMVYYRSARLVYLFATVVLIAVLFFGTTIAGTRGWFRIAGFSFQPVELAKVAFILMNARLIDRYGRRFEGMHFVIGSGLIAGVLMGLTFLQPDLGSALVIFGMWFLYLLTARVRFRYVALVAISAITVAILGWFFVLQEYQKDRFATFLDPSADPLGAGYNLNQSMIAIGAGRLTGTGLGYGSQSQLQFLPEAQTDFIFAVIAEELGFVGVLVLFGLFIGLFWRLTTHVSHANSDFAAYTLIGICLLFAIQVVVNVGGTTGLLPITGVTLPFVSYGGSSFLMNCMLIGIAESIRRGSEQTTSSLGI